MAAKEPNLGPSAAITASGAQVTVVEVREPLQFGATRAGLTPLPAETAHLSADEVLRLIPGSLPTEGSYELLLGSFTDVALAEIRPDGSPEQLLVDRPAWVLLQKNTVLPLQGPVDGPVNGTVADVYDARTGADLLMFYGDGPATCALAAGAVPDSCGANPPAKAP